MKLLLLQVADPNLKNDAGAAALQWALKQAEHGTGQLLKQAGATE